MHNTNDQLMEFQEFIMQTFYTASDATNIQEKLRNYSCDPAINHWLSTLTLPMLEVAARMTQHWGVKLTDDEKS